MSHQDEIFNSLVQNAFDYLKHAIEDFDKAPKYSVIHFCAAVEMLLKARLMREHWALIVSKPESANIDKFMAGDFTSVSIYDAIERIQNIIARSKILGEAFKSFRDLAKHRNKMIHFFHTDIEKNTKEKDEIIVEQARSWFYLYRLLTIDWANYFSAFKDNITSADNAMKKHQTYLSTKFQAIQKNIENEHSSGRQLKNCQVCGFEAELFTLFDINSSFSEYLCFVCEHEGIQVQINCSGCKEIIFAQDVGNNRCEHCSNPITPEDIVAALTQDTVNPKDYYDTGVPANCCKCGGYETIVNSSGKNFCTSCFFFFEDAEIRECQWCNSMNAGDMEHSYYSGCVECLGMFGHYRDKDD